MKPFTIYWGNGKREILYGETIADALERNDYVRDALYMATCYTEGICENFEFINGKWVYIKLDN